MRILFSLLLVLLCDRMSFAGGLSPQESLSRFNVADGFELELFASEPEIRQPVTISFDARGRLWTIQYLQYPTPAGLKPVEVDQFLRTKYDRMPEPPPHGPRGADRITIAEDTDGDGRADLFKDFLSGLNLASGLAIGHGGVFVLQAPYLLFYADRNSDDRPDGDPEVLLTGFGLEDAHAVGNSLQFGPDGWLYGAQGSTVTANIRGIEFQQGIWRYHPLTKEFELFAEGGGNTWGVDFDRSGQLIAGTNFGGVAALHHVQGAYYVKNFGKHGALHNPHAYGFFEHLPYSEPQHILGGEHVMCGGVLYQGGAFPAEFNNRYITCALLHRAIYWHNIQPQGSSFASGWGGKLVTTDDVWFRPVDLCTGPDGAIYIADWYDIRATHVDPNDTWDRTNGRIYRLKQTGSPSVNSLNLAKESSAQLAGRLKHANIWSRRQAREILSLRQDPAVYDELKKNLTESKDETLQLESLWTIFASGGWSDELAISLLSHPSAHVRGWTVRLIGDARKVSAAGGARLISLAKTDPSPVVRNQLACSAQRLPVAIALGIVNQLLRRDEDLADPQIPLLLWWALEKHSGEDLPSVLALFDDHNLWDQPLVERVIVERIARRLAAGASDELIAAAHLLHKAPSDKHRFAIIAGMELHLTDRLVVDPPAELLQAISEIWSSGQRSAEFVRLAARVGLPDAQRTAVDSISNARLAAADRASYIELLGLIQKSESAPALLDLIDKENNAVLQSAAVRVLQALDSDEIAQRLVRAYPRLSGQIRTQIRQALLSRPAWTLALFEQVDAGSVKAADLPVQEVQQGLLHSQSPESPIARLARKHWGSVQSITPGEITARIAAVNNEIRRGDGDSDRGRPLFAKHCATCHTLNGEGNKIGPDLTGADRGNRPFLLQNIVNPAGQVREEYISYTALTDDGRVLTGLIADSTPETVTLLSATNERTVLSRDTLDELKPSSTSLMPEKILDGLSGQEIRDLFAYLQSGVAQPK